MSRPREPGPRVIVLGADGLDADLTRRYLAAGELPCLARLAARGGWGPLRTTNPAESPVAWASFATGLNPGKHGIYDFLQRDPRTYGLQVGPLAVRPRRDGTGWEAINRRQGDTLWALASAAGRSCALLRVPGTCPPEPVKGRMLSGLGVPDLLGSWGTSHLYTTLPASGRDVTHLDLASGAEIETAICGPQSTSAPLQVARYPGELRLRCQGQEVRLSLGDWSPWLSLRFEMPPGAAWAGLARFYLWGLDPEVRLYLSPLHLDPRQPALPLTWPAAYADELVARHGLYSTLGWPEDNAGLSEGRLDEAGFLHQVEEAFAQQREMLLDTLAAAEHDLVIAVFEATDRVQHMFWRHQDERDPWHTPQGERAWGREILSVYQRFDALVGEVMGLLGPQDALLVLSDHGFKPVYRLANVNNWLRDHGYLAMRADAPAPGGAMHAIDWKRTQAYALGLSKIYINLRGREAQGQVEPGEYDALCRELARELLAWRDPETGQVLLRQVYLRDELYAGDQLGRSGDLILGFEAGYRTSQPSAAGRLAAEAIRPNRSPWSADHCSIDPSLVAGVLCANRPLDFSQASILDLAPTILDLLGVPPPPGLDGRSLWL